MVDCDICGRSKIKSLSGFTRHREVCQRRKRREQNLRREQSAYSRRKSLATTNPKQFAELPENGDEHILGKLGRDASPEPILQSLTSKEYSIMRPRQFAELSEDNEFEPIATENRGRDASPEWPIDRKGSWI
jgi:hypothetical protein